LSLDDQEAKVEEYDQQGKDEDKATNKEEDKGEKSDHRLYLPSHQSARTQFVIIFFDKILKPRRQRSL